MIDLEGELLYANNRCPAGEIWLNDSDVIILPKGKILRHADFVNLVFTRNIYGVLPLSAAYSFGPRVHPMAVLQQNTAHLSSSFLSPPLLSPRLFGFLPCTFRPLRSSWCSMPKTTKKAAAPKNPPRKCVKQCAAPDKPAPQKRTLKTWPASHAHRDRPARRGSPAGRKLHRRDYARGICPAGAETGSSALTDYGMASGGCVLRRGCQFFDPVCR